MSHDEPTQVGSLAGKIDELADAFEQQWRAGAQPRLEDFLVDCAQAQRAALLRELLFVELQLKNRAGAPVAEGDYCQRFTAHQQVVSEVFASLFPDRSDTSALEMGQGSTRATPPGILPQEQARRRELTDLPCAFGEYDLLEKLGQGGMGVVFKARQRTANRLVALKLIRPENLTPYLSDSRAEWLARFRNEVEAAAKLDHDHVVTVYDVGQVDGQPYYAMRYIDGESLYDKVKHGPLDPKVAVRYVEQIARALAEAHAQGILHRDIKPHNILVDQRSDRALLTDFGLAKLTTVDQQLTASLTRFGSPPYMSPEQTVDAGKVTAASDIYGLGATLYHLLTGRPPFQAATIAETFRQAAQEEPVAPSQLNRAIEHDVQTIALKCLNKVPTRRYASAADLADDLGRYLRGEPIHARPVSRIERARRWCRRNRALAVAASAALLFLVSGLVTTTAFAIRSQHFAYRAATNADRAREKELSAKRFAAKEERARKAAEANARSLRQQYAQSYFSQGLLEYDAGRPESGIIELQRGWAVMPDNNPLKPHWQRVMFDRIERGGQRASLPLRHQGRIGFVAFSPLGDRIVTLSYDHTARLWDAFTGAPIGVPMHLDASPLDDPQDPKSPRHRYAMVITPDDEGVENRPPGLVTAEFSSKGDRLLTCGGHKTVRLWNARTGLALGNPMQHQNHVTTISFSPQGDRVLTASEDRTAQLWDARTSAPLGEPMRHESSVTDASFSPHGDRVLTVVKGLTARLWDARTGKLVGEPIRHIPSFKFSPQGDRLLTSSQDDTSQIFQLWDVRKGTSYKTAMRIEGDYSYGLFSTQGDRLLTVSDRAARLWDANTTLPLKATTFSASPFSDEAAFSPRGDVVAAACFDGNVMLWNAHNGEPMGEPIQHEGLLAHIVGFSANEDRVITANDYGSLQIREIKTGTLVQSTNHDGSITLSPQRNRFFSRSYDNTVLLWDAQTGEPIGEAMQLEHATLSAISPQGDRIVAVRNNIAHIWNADPPAPLREESPAFVEFGAQGDHIVAVDSDNTARIEEIWTRERVGFPMAHSRPIIDAIFSPSGRRLFTRCDDNTLRSWNVVTGAVIGKEVFHDAPLAEIVFSPQEDRFLTKRNDNTAQLWEGETGKALGHVLRHDWRRRANFTPQGNRVLLWCNDNSLQFWDGNTGSAIGSPITCESGAKDLRFSSTGDRALISCNNENARIVDTYMGVAVGEPMENKTLIGTNQRFSRNGDRFFTQSRDSAVHIWDARTGARMGNPIRHNNLTVAYFSPEGDVLVTGDADGKSRLWNGRTGVEVRRQSKDEPRLWVDAPGAYILSQTFGGASPSINSLNPVNWFDWHSDVFRHYNVADVSIDRVASLNDDTLEVWDTNNGVRLGMPIRQEGISKALLIPRSDRVLTTDANGTLWIWDWRTGSKIVQLIVPTADLANRFVISPNGDVVAGCFDGDGLYARLWDTQTGRPIGEPIRGFHNLAFGRKGDFILTIKDKAARFWDPYTGASLGRVMHDEDGFSNITFSPRGNLFINESENHKVTFWNLKQRAPKSSLADYVELQTGHFVDVNGNVRSLNPDELEQRLTTLRSADSQWLIHQHLAAKAGQQSYHQSQLRRALKNGDIATARFHHGWLKSLKFDTSEFDLSLKPLEGHMEEKPHEAKNDDS